MKTNSRFEDESAFPPPPHLEHKNLVEMFAANAVERDRKTFAQCCDASDNQFILMSWAEAADEVLQLAIFLRDVIGVKRGDRVAIFSGTRYEWIIADFAILALGAVSTSIYHSLTAEDAGFILWETETRCVFIENEEQLQKLKKITSTPFPVPKTEEFPGGDVTLKLDAVISFERTSASHFFREIVGNRNKPVAETAAELAALSTETKRSDLASIVYTSGTTGPPKGVLQSHENHLAMLDAVLYSGLLGTGEAVFLFLPLAHSFARVCAYGAVAPGGFMIFPAVCDKQTTKFDAKRVFRDLRASNPAIFPSVPRMFEKVMEGLTAESPEGFQNRLAAWAVKTYREKSKTKPSNVKEKLSFVLADSVVKKVRRKIFGNRLLYCVSGGAPIAREVIQFFDEIGVVILEGYGLTETTPAITANTTQFRKIGTVGRRFQCNEMKIAESDGEILVRGGNIALGYYKRPKDTAEAWRDGWFHTGDIGNIDADGYLSITDRKKDIIVTAGGKKVPPVLVEGKLKNSPLISSVFVAGERKPYLVALITLNDENVRAALKSQGGTTSGNLANDTRVTALIEAEVSKVNAQLASFEQIKRFRVLAGDFTIENGLLSPTLKMKRPAIVSRFAAELDALYK